MEPTSQPTQQPVPQAPPTTPPSTAQLQAVVDLMPNVTIFGAKSVLMEWTADNRLRIYEMNFDTNQATGMVLDVPIPDIKKVTGSINMLTFHIGDKTYRTLFARMQTAGVGVAGAAYAYGELQASGAKLWIDKLKQNGIKVSLLGWKLSFAIAIGIVLLVAVIVIIVQMQNGSF